MPSYSQGYQPRAKLGTVFYGESATASTSELADDLSQEGADLVDGGAFIYAASDGRFLRAAPRTVLVRVELLTGASGTLFAQGEELPATPSLRLQITAGELLAEVDGTEVLILEITLAGVGEHHVVVWTSEPNPNATGASDAELSWLLVYNEATGVASRSGPAAHPVPAANDDLAIFGALDTAGADPCNGRITRCGFHHRSVTLAEAYNDHVTAAGTLTTTATLEREAIPLTVESGLGARDELYGPVPYWAARNTRQLRRRTTTARSERWPALPLSNGFSRPEHLYTIPGTTYRVVLGQLLAVPVQPTVNRFWVRAHVKLWVTAGAEVFTGLRLYCWNRPPQLAEVFGVEPLEQRYIGAVVRRDDTAAGLGEWTINGFLTIVRGTVGIRRGWAYVAPAWSIDPDNASANDGNARVQWNAVQLCPCHAMPVDGGPGELSGEGA